MHLALARTGEVTLVALRVGVRFRRSDPPHREKRLCHENMYRHSDTDNLPSRAAAERTVYNRPAWAGRAVSEHGIRVWKSNLGIDLGLASGEMPHKKKPPTRASKERTTAASPCHDRRCRPPSSRAEVERFDP